MNGRRQDELGYPPSRPNAVAGLTALPREGTPSLSIHRAHFGAGGVSCEESRLPDLAEREMRLQVGAEPKLRRDLGRDAGHGDVCDFREDPAQLRPFVDEYPRVVPWDAASSISRRRCRAAPWSAMATYTAKSRRTQRRSKTE